MARWLNATALLSLAAAATLRGQSVQVPPAVRAILDDACIGCHGARDPEAGLDFGALGARPLPAALLTLIEARDRVAARVMPPPGYGELEAEQVAQFVAWADTTIDTRRGEVACAPTPVPARRLSRAQYERAIFDLFGVAVPAAADFPAEDLAFGFATMAEAMSFSAVHVEKYLAAAEQVAAAVCGGAEGRRLHVELEELAVGHEGMSTDGEFVNFYTEAALTVPLPARPRGRFAVRVRAFGDQAGDAPPRLCIDLDGVRVAVHDVGVTRRRPQVYTAEVELRAGEHALRLSFDNDYYQPQHPDPRRRDRNLHLDWVEVDGPLDSDPVPAGSRWWLAADPGGADIEGRLRAVLLPLLERAWRSPVGEDALTPLLRAALPAATASEAWPHALRLALVAALASPRFVLRLEAAGAADAGRAYQLATRLSFLLWGSVPDAVLLDRARDGSLADASVFDAEVGRMLRDARAAALATDFAAQWLELPSLSTMAFDSARFGDVSPALLHDMRRETELLFEAVLREGRPARDLLLADFSFRNRRLAEHYELAGSFDDELRRVTVADPRRRGLLGHASILALTSNPTRTSPVKRGKWILDNLLGAPPAAPPPGNAAFPPGVAVDTAAGLRVQMARHRRDEACATCHVRMDALGLALENFDAVGRLREREGGRPIDASAVLPDGRRVHDSVELRQVLAADGAFLRCLVQKVFLFAVGRPPTASERVWLDAEARALPPDAALADVVRLVLRTAAFRGA